MTMDERVTAYIEKHPKWSGMLHRLRHLLLDAGLAETIKWGGPVYVHRGKNVVGLGAYKKFVSLWFFQGVELTDPLRVLTQAQETTKSLRQWRFTDEQAIDEDAVRSYIDEAIRIAERTKKRKGSAAETEKALEIPDELADIFDKDKKLIEKFEAFPFYKRKEFVEYVASAKREATRRRRAERCAELIERGEGLHDRYR